VILATAVFFAANVVPRQEAYPLKKQEQIGHISGTLKPPLPIANKERANPSSVNVVTMVRSSLHSLVRVALRYIISSAIIGSDPNHWFFVGTPATEQVIRR
jgi:hypothetical protein